MKSNTRERVAKALETLELIGKAGDGRIHFGDIVRLSNARGELREALKEPLTNCEVGTAEEQACRFYEFCMKHQSGIENMCSPVCPCIDQCDKNHCAFKWAHMPYESEVAK